MLPFALTDTLLGLDPHLRHLAASGWKVRAAATRKARGPIDLLDSPPRYLEVQGRAVTEVRLKLGGTIFFSSEGGHSSLRLGGVPVYLSRTVPMQSHWLVPVDPAGRLEDFQAKLSTRRGGFLWLGEIESVAWEGGVLAARLNEEPEASLAGARFLRRGERLFVTPDPDRRCVRVIHQTEVVARLSVLSSDVLSAEWHLPERALLATIEHVAEAIDSLKKRARRSEPAKRPARRTKMKPKTAKRMSKAAR
ncbi:MAG: hypothetical protein QM765_08490 [Myxococcales bacterium]